MKPFPTGARLARAESVTGGNFMSKDRIQHPAKAELVRDCIRRFPNLSTHSIARKIYKANPAFWPNVEAARSSVRFVRGNMGNAKRKVRDKAFHRPNGGAITLPESRAQPWEVYTLQSRRNLILSDVHAPYHDPEAVKAAIEYGRKYKPTAILLNGDGIDFFSISRFLTDPRQRNLKAEIDSFKQFLGYLRQEFPKARIIWKLGNHEERYEHYLIMKAPELLDIAVVGLESLFDCERLGVEIVRDKRFIMLGKLHVLHGHEFPNGISSPVNPARGFFMRGIESVLAGHLHRTSEHAEATLAGRFITCWSTGCLCDMRPAYSPVNKWNQGFATVDVFPNGDFNVTNLKIHNGKVL